MDYAAKLGHEAKCHLLTSSGADVGLRYRPRADAAAAAQPAKDDSAVYDRWGFEEGDAAGSGSTSEAESTKDMAKRIKKERERAEKWAKMMHPAAVWERTLKKERAKVRLRCIKGIPESARGTAWLLMMRSAQRKATYPADHYAQLLVPDTTCGEQIDLDINRSFRTHVLFKERYGNGEGNVGNSVLLLFPLTALEQQGKSRCSTS